MKPRADRRPGTDVPGLLERQPEWDTRAGRIDLAIPEVRRRSYFPDGLLEHRSRTRRAWSRWWRRVLVRSPRLGEVSLTAIPAYVRAGNTRAVFTRHAAET